jgi:hypothetical protein
MTKPDMPEELKPCPFCGGEAEFLNSLQTVQKVFLNHDTGCIANVVRYFSSKEDAINAWNTRADQSPPLPDEVRWAVEMLRQWKCEINTESFAAYVETLTRAAEQAEKLADLLRKEMTDNDNLRAATQQPEVVTVFDEDITSLADFYVGRFYDPSDGCYTPEKQRKNQCKMERKDLRRWIEVLAMNGFQVSKTNGLKVVED